MKITPKHNPKGNFTNFLFTPETKAEQEELVKVYLRAKEIERMNEFVKELEKQFGKGTK